MKRVVSRAQARTRKLLRWLTAKISIRSTADGDYLLPYPFRHRSLKPMLSSDYETCARRYGPMVASKWSRDGCGIASATIAVDAIKSMGGSVTPALPPVTQLCEEYRERAYVSGVGWTHRGLVNFAREHGLCAFNEPHETTEAMCRRLLDGWVPIASVTLYFRGGEEVTREDGVTIKKPKGGHLIVVVGVRIARGKIDGFFIDDCQDPVSRDGETAVTFVLKTLFASSFSGKVIYLSGSANPKQLAAEAVGAKQIRPHFRAEPSQQPLLERRSDAAL
jgi:hypothetical protein